MGAGANHWGGPVGAAPAALVAVLRKFWLDVLPILRMGTSCMAHVSEQDSSSGMCQASFEDTT